MASTAEEIAALRGTRPASLKDLLVDPSFSRLWRAMLVSSLGDWVGFVAVASLVAHLGGQRLGALAVAGVMMARLLPSVLFGPFAGVFADRFDRRRLMVGADVARGLMYASMPFLPGLGYIFLMSFFIECLSLLWTPAKDASVPNLVPRRQLPNANSVTLITAYGTLPLGASIFTLLTGLAGVLGSRVHYLSSSRPEFLALWLDALTFFFSARMVWGLDLRQNMAARVRAKLSPRFSFRSAIEEIREGYRFLRDHPTVRSMTLGIVIAFAGVGSVISLGPVFARYSVNAGSTGFGILITAFGVGMAAGIALSNYLSRLFEKDKLFYVSMLGAAGCLFVIAVMPTIGLASAFTVPMGVAVGLTWVTGYTMLQENVSDEFRGRTFGTLNVWARLALFISLVAFPALSAAIGPHSLTIGTRVLDLSGTRIALWVGGVVVVFAGLASGRGLKRSRLARPRPLGLTLRGPRKEIAGVFIAFEGVEGAGKGTQIELARRFVASRGRQVVVTREPGGTDLGDRLRDTLLSPTMGSLDPRAEALLFAATRAQHVMTVIRPALQDGKVVLCDRFIDSSIAYQGVARGLGEQDVLTLNAWATQGLFPDLVVLLQLDPEVGLARAKAGDELDRIESEDLEFHARVADAYLKIADEHPDRFAVVDANGTPEEVHVRVKEAIERVLKSNSEGSQEPS
jgi:dTMP kinase